VRRLAVAPVALAVAGLVASPAGADVWKRLHRPLHIPRVAAGTSCPTTPASGHLPSMFGGPTAFGRGPVYPAFGAGQPQAIVRFSYPPPAGSEVAGSTWSGQKVPWIRAPRYRGPVLIRGRQLDGPYHLRFGLELVPPTELRIGRWGTAAGSRWGFRGSTTRLRAPGCYAYQIDGLTFSRVIVFQAELYS
jgi:hypothetical protein